MSRPESAVDRPMRDLTDAGGRASALIRQLDDLTQDRRDALATIDAATANISSIDAERMVVLDKLSSALAELERIAFPGRERPEPDDTIESAPRPDPIQEPFGRPYGGRGLA